MLCADVECGVEWNGERVGRRRVPCFLIPWSLLPLRLSRDLLIAVTRGSCGPAQVIDYVIPHPA